jgi:hypothetical protein
MCSISEVEMLVEPLTPDVYGGFGSRCGELLFRDKVYTRSTLLIYPIKNNRNVLERCHFFAFFCNDCKLRQQLSNILRLRDGGGMVSKIIEIDCKPGTRYEVDTGPAERHSFDMFCRRKERFLGTRKM